VTAAIPAFRALPRELQQAAGAAAGLGLTMFLPWYEKSFVAGGEAKTANLSAFGVFSFVEAAVLLVAAGVLYLVWARAQRKAFHLPGGDGTVIMGAGAWAVALLVWRLFDKPDVNDQAANVGIQWGMFVALLVAGVLTAAGARVRAAHRPEPPNPAADDAGWERPPRPERGERRAPRQGEATAVTEVLREPPGWEGDVPEAPGRVEPAAPRTGAPGPAERSARRRAAREADAEGPDDGDPPPPEAERLF
jgi:hypothetical protein